MALKHLWNPFRIVQRWMNGSLWGPNFRYLAGSPISPTHCYIPSRCPLPDSYHQLIVLYQPHITKLMPYASPILPTCCHIPAPIPISANHCQSISPSYCPIPALYHNLNVVYQPHVTNSLVFTTAKLPAPYCPISPYTTTPFHQVIVVHQPFITNLLLITNPLLSPILYQPHTIPVHIINSSKWCAPSSARQSFKNVQNPGSGLQVPGLGSRFQDPRDEIEFLEKWDWRLLIWRLANWVLLAATTLENLLQCVFPLWSLWNSCSRPQVDHLISATPSLW